MRYRLGEILAASGELTLQGLLKASEWQKENGGTIERALLATGAVTEDVLTGALSRASGLPGLTREHLLKAPLAVVSHLAPDVRRRLRAVAFEETATHLKVAVSEPDSPVLVTGLVGATGFEIELFVVADPVLEDCLARFERRESGVKTPAPAILERAAPEPGGDPVGRLARALLSDAVRKREQELEVGFDARGGYVRTHAPSHPPYTRRLSLTLVPALMDWFETRMTKDPLGTSHFCVEILGDETGAGRHDVRMARGDGGALRLFFGRTVGAGVGLEPCRHARAAGDVFCPDCGEAI